MKQFLVFLMALSGTCAFAAEKKAYDTHFDNPVVDERIQFESCAIEGAMYGILTNDMGDVLCWGPSPGDSKKDIYVFKAAKSKTQEYFEEVEYKNLRAWGDQEAGIREASVKLRQLTPKLKRPKKAKVSTLKFRTQWTYSEGSTMLEGRLPGKKVKFSAPVFYIPDLNEELEDFAAELGSH